MSDYVFRDTVQSSDADAVRTMAAATEKFRENEIDVAVELVDERLKRGDESGYFFVFADHEGHPAGYVCFGPISVTLHGFDLYWIIVHPDHQGRGLGRKLLVEAERRIAAAGGGQIYIETSGREDYLPTRFFYERCGYQAEATIRDFYAPADDKVVFVRRLDA